MDIRQIKTKALTPDVLAPLGEIAPSVVMVFGPVEILSAPGAFAALTAGIPGAALIGCSTAGEITAKGVSDGACVITALRFDKVRHRVAEAPLAAMDECAAAGRAVGKALMAPDLKGILLFGPGVGVNGSAIIEGAMAELGAGIPISGGLAGDGGAFTRTFTVTPSGIHSNRVVAIGLYGEGLRLSHGSFGGWSPFGPARKVTRAEGNILYELDGLPALDLYRTYLGDYAKDLPASGLLFPFEMLREDQSAVGLIRTILGVDAETGGVILAGDIDPHGHLRLMHANVDGLVDGAAAAAKAVGEGLSGDVGSGLAVLVSCVGRKLVMGDAVDEEIEAVADHLGKQATLAGFYSYGEIAPFSSTTDCKLHNQTMTITFIGES
ncbi:MAG: FIST C-terminal domain-containing protein [Magnetospirillum sp.]|nr:FIST C-terminal domain-containing protein [Magnetospirillum sp.]